ncbi:PMT4 [[Candida] subhashii]|uniref:dolichyl-phosphate-mannose--protein mannosyltransferase n=1 Tax=[Candida] subhashii TaxID=561895 RepID=A0A8J5Q437_9ASCO|nr:PMT4 [[Candida] subhashii]KAG7661364.1 PMT4 [[Candida] subhashii]
MSQQVRKRGAKKANPNGPTNSAAKSDDIEILLKESEPDLFPVSKQEPESKYYVALVVITIFAIYTRFTKLGTPSQVVFDEVHFGKFASYYLEGTYFFDLHPPFAKLLIAFVGWLIGYNGKFKFDAIGDSYIENSVPYIAYRSLMAIEGTITIPIMFLTMKTLGFSVPACLLSSIIVCFDNAQVADSRLILLDATLILSVALTMYSYAKFSTYRKQPFSKKWWTWLYATGISLSCVISTKYVGVFTYVTIGIAVLHELWILLDYRRGLTMGEFAKHFFARLWALIIVPFVIYLYWFYLHFSILSKSGTGDNFMSAEFQETLLESPMAKLAKPVKYFDQLTIQHKDTGAYLHSHSFEYPLRYEDGRISSNSQQVTCVTVNDPQDPNNQWEIVPTKPELEAGSDVYTEDVIRLRHVGTGGYLLTHDVASPLKATNEEFTVVYDEDAEKKFNETLFRIKLDVPKSSPKKKNQRKLVKTKATNIRILHIDTVVAMWTHNDELLPEWAFGQQEVSGNKKIPDKDNVWVFDTITNLAPGDARAVYVPKEVKTMPFLKKWWELQGLMFYHNNQLSSDHPFASSPDSWPLALSGVSFYNDSKEKKQIFFTGNIIGYWLEVCLLAIYVGIILADQLTRRRNLTVLSRKARSRLYNTLGFFFIGWCAHYFPFFLMGRQKFLHHYLPAHLIAALFSGGLVEFVTSNNRAYVSKENPSGIHRLKLVILVAIFSAGIIWFFFYFRPITYGDVSLTPEEVRAREWFDIKLHYSNWGSAIITRYIHKSNLAMSVKTYLTKLRQKIDSKTLSFPYHVVAGNQSADMDSVVSAITFAYFTNLQTKQDVIPLINIPRADFRLRRDIDVLLKSHQITQDLLYFVEDLGQFVTSAISANEKLKFTLVDHNNLQGEEMHFLFEQTPDMVEVVSIIDHHADEGVFKNAEPRIIRSCGSNSSMIFNYFYETCFKDDHEGFLKNNADAIELLLGPLVIDTSNMTQKVEEPDVEAFKVYQKALNADAFMQEFITTNNGSGSNPYEQFYSILKSAKKDLTGFSFFDILRKDYKQFTFNSGDRVGFSSIGKSLKWVFKHYSPEEIKSTLSDALKTLGVDLFVITSSYTQKENGQYTREFAYYYEVRDHKKFNHLAELAKDQLELNDDIYGSKKLKKGQILKHQENKLFQL